MRKKKEIIIIILIISVTIFLAFMPMILSKRGENVEEPEKKPTTISITIKGELKKEEINIKIPYGYSYGYIISKIQVYLNNYSIVDDNKTKRYYEDTVIVIKSTDINKDVTDEIDTNNGLININKAQVDDLVKLYGIGEKRAKAIIEYREKKKIETFEELRELLGVSNEVIENIKEKAFL